MGIFLDTVEDNDESKGWRVETLRQKLGIPPSTPRQFPSVACPVCQQGFFSDTELQNHIFHNHKDRRCYIRLNERILREGISYEESEIQQLEAYSSDTQAVLVLQLDTSSPIHIQLDNTRIDLAVHIPPNFAGELKLCLKDSSGQQDITCYCRSLPELDYSDLDKTILELQRRVNVGEHYIDWHKYKKPLLQSSEHLLRQKYLRGMLEYLWAHNQEVNCHSLNYQSHEHRVSCYSDNYQLISQSYENACGYLQPFASYVPQQTRRAIALKMNWFLELKGTPETSLFYLAWHFFKHSYEIVASVTLPLPNVRQSNQKPGILLDNFHQELLDVLKIYYCKRSSLGNGCLVKLETLLQETTNSNYRDKLALLKARLFREWGDDYRAKQAYYSIKYHRLFKAEASTFNV